MQLYNNFMYVTAMTFNEARWLFIGGADGDEKVARVTKSHGFGKAHGNAIMMCELIAVYNIAARGKGTCNLLL